MQTTYSEQQIRTIENQAIAQGVSGDEMMRRAGAAAFSHLVHKWSQARSIVLFCGSGNNGGDGYVVARLAKIAGLDVCVRYLGDTNSLRDEAHHAFKACRQQQVEMKPFDPEEKFDVDLAVDALLGIGLRGELRAEVATAIEVINSLDCPVLALDIPSGLEADKGIVTNVAVKADSTVTFIGVKQGMVVNSGVDYCGEIICCSLDLPEELYEF